MKLLIDMAFILVITGFYIVPYYLTDKFRRNRISKYIPSLLCLISILILCIKFLFFSRGYSGIADITFIIIFAQLLVIFFLIALFFEFKKR